MAHNHSVDDGNKVPGEERHAPRWLVGQEIAELIDIGRVEVTDLEILQGDREFLVRDAAVGPSFGSQVERFDYIGLGKGWCRPVERR